ncbi:hypothetical protein BDZ97DRAFT_1773172 [Flammula alnicola]|nr:hypothetical protein BDZ97DRAFT_1773172 [Flammula alnicola]
MSVRLSTRLLWSRHPCANLGLRAGHAGSLVRRSQWKPQEPWRVTSPATRLNSTSTLNYLPPKARPYTYLTRIDKPIGTLLLFYPCGWSLPDVEISLFLTLPFG